MKERVLSVYRSYLCQVRALPHIYLRRFFIIKGADDFRSVLQAKSVDLRRSKLRRVSKDLRLLQAANGGKSFAFDRMLDIAYGRVGKLRWESMEPLLPDSRALLVSSDKVKTEKKRSPIYSPELVALLTSSISRTTKPLQKHQLVSPPSLGRAKMDSEDRVLLGPPSKRREYNIRWRFFKKEWKKVYPPLIVSQQHPANHTNPQAISNPPTSFCDQSVNPLEDLLALTGPSSKSPEPSNKGEQVSDVKSFDGSLPVRWVRRRYRALLGRVPLLIARPLPRDNSKCTYDIRLADNAISTSRPHPPRLRFVDAEDVSWISDINPVLRSEGGRE